MSLRIGVVFGGKSVEHEVSIISALQMMENMDQEAYQIIPIYLSKNNDFYFHESMNKIDFFKDLKAVENQAKLITFIKKGNGLGLHEITKKQLKKLFDIDVIFLVVHGTGCEDGTLSAYFELLNIPYVGSNVLSSAINQNKWKMKQIFANNNIPIVKYFGFYDQEYFNNEDLIINQCEAIGYPLIVKPAQLGSSVGISKCTNKESLKQAILTAIQYDQEIVVEEAIQNLMELNCSVLGNYAKQEASEVEKVMQKDEILSYKDKYLSGDKNTKGIVNTNRELPANIPYELKDEVQSLAKAVFKILGGNGVSRIDFLYDQDQAKLYVNEINTIPGSLSFYLWQETNLTYKELINQLINLAIEKYRNKESKIFTYQTNILAIPRNFTKGKLK